MEMLATSAALGSLYCLVAIVLVIHFRVSGFLNLSILGLLLLSPYLIAKIIGEDTSILKFVFACLVSIVVVSILNFVIEVLIFNPITRLQGAMKVIASTCVLFIILTSIDIFWTEGVKLESPVGTKRVTLLHTDLLWIDLITITVTLAILFGLLYFLNRTTVGNRFSAYALDRNTAQAYGISPMYAKVTLSVITGLVVSSAGVLLASPGSPRSGVISVIFYALIALSPVIISRHSDLTVCLIGAFVVAFFQTYTSANIESLNKMFQNVASMLSITTDVTLGPTFSDRFIPFFIAIIILVVVPKAWIRDDING